MLKQIRLFGIGLTSTWLFGSNLAIAQLSNNLPNLNTKATSTTLPAYCGISRYRDFFVYFVQGYDEEKNAMRDLYTWEHVELRNYAQTEHLLAVAKQKTYKAFRLKLDNDWIAIDRQNPHFYDHPSIQISHRKPGDPPADYDRVRLDLKNLKFNEKPLITRLKAQQYARIEFRDVSDRSFRVDYADLHYGRRVDANSDLKWIETSEVEGAYVFEHRNGCWYLTQDLRVPN